MIIVTVMDTKVADVIKVKDERRMFKMTITLVGLLAPTQHKCMAQDE